MNRRNLVGILKANSPQYVWAGLPVWIGASFAALGRSPTLSEWGPISLLLVTMFVIICTVGQFSNAYADRHEDWLYVPSNPLVTGELDAGVARVALIVQHILCGLLVIALWVVTHKHWLIVVLVVGWLVSLQYSMPPLRLKETIVSPFAQGICTVLSLFASWMVVSNLNLFIIAFGVFLFLIMLAFGTTVKLRKTFEDYRSGQIQVEEGKGVWDLKTSGLGVKVKWAVAMEVFAGLGAFILLPIYWRLGIFENALLIPLVTLPLLCMILIVVFRIKDPLENQDKCVKLMAMTNVFIIFSFLGVAFVNVLHWAFLILVFFLFMTVFFVLERAIRPVGAPYQSDVAKGLNVA